MEYLPTLTLNFPGGMTNAYRLRERQVEFQRGDGTWRVLDHEDVQLHFLLHTEVSKWLLRYEMEANPHTRECGSGSHEPTVKWYPATVSRILARLY